MNRTDLFYLSLAFVSLTLFSCDKENPKTDPSTISDIDGNQYNVIKIGTQLWTQENLRVTRYANGESIETTNPATKDIRSESTPKYQWAYEGNNNNIAVYGRLYTWYVITDARGLCPAGWHIPSDAEWSVLGSYLGGDNIAGGKLKESGTAHWMSPNTAADNSSGFTALPSGFRYNNGTFSDAVISCTFWTSTEYDNESPWLRDLYAIEGYLNKYYGYGKSFGFSVRCIKD
jgi:uncharacterized protein (TIGR02145 family)